MILTNEFTVGFGIETVWTHMIDLANMADCLPGATIEEFEPPNVYKGAVRVRIGPMTVDYKGQATLVDIDEQAHTSTILLKAREAKGQGSAVATLRSRLEATAKGTRVVTETDLQITGPQAQFGKGVLEDVGSRVLDEFSKRLEAKMSGETTEVPVGNGVGNHPGTGGHHGTDDEVLDLGRVVAQTMVLRVAKIAGVVVALAVTLKLVRRRGPRS
jgi:carbon monoxide dehydrogenase subunit G